MAKASKLPISSELDHTNFEAMNRSFFSREKLSSCERWFKELPSWALGFQCQALLSNGLLNTSEVLDDLKPHITKILKGSNGVPRSVGIVRHFSVVLQRPENARNMRILAEELLIMAIDEYDSARGPTSHMKVVTAGDHMCAQVAFTPTAMFCTGPFPDRSNRVCPGHQLVTMTPR